MTRETRLNLWFLAIFLLISLPGAVILFIKKLDPSASRMDLPDAVHARLPFMAPVPAPPETRWIVPPQTHQWLSELTQQKTGGASLVSAIPPGPEWEPVISSDHRLQVMSVYQAGAVTHLAVVVWDGPSPANGRPLQFALRNNGRELPVSIVRADSVEIPAPIRHEWVDMGFARPPFRIEWVDCDVKAPMEANDQVTLTSTGTSSPAARSSVNWTVR